MCGGGGVREDEVAAVLEEDPVYTMPPSFSSSLSRIPAWTCAKLSGLASRTAIFSV